VSASESIGGSEEVDGVPGGASVPEVSRLSSHSVKRVEMPGDPNKCREHARNCAQLARHASSTEARDHFASLSTSWLRLAAEIESSQKLLDLIGEVSGDLVPHVEAAE
jgi:hypothetical protein